MRYERDYLQKMVQNGKKGPISKRCALRYKENIFGLDNDSAF
jgi:hypothetical protein